MFTALFWITKNGNNSEWIYKLRSSQTMECSFSNKKEWTTDTAGVKSQRRYYAGERSQPQKMTYGKASTYMKLSKRQNCTSRQWSGMDGGPDYNRRAQAQGRFFERWDVLECKLTVHVLGSSSALNNIKDNTSSELKVRRCLVSAASSLGHLETFPKLHALPHPLVTTSYSKHWTPKKKKAAPLAMWLTELTNLSAKMLTLSAIFNKHYLVFHSQVKFHWRVVLDNNIKVKLP